MVYVAASAHSIFDRFGIAQIPVGAVHFQAVYCAVIAVGPQQNAYRFWIAEKTPQQVGAQMTVRPGQQDHTPEP
jgi:hypothetical protein